MDKYFNRSFIGIAASVYVSTSSTYSDFNRSFIGIAANCSFLLFCHFVFQSFLYRYCCLISSLIFSISIYFNRSFIGIAAVEKKGKDPFEFKFQSFLYRYCCSVGMTHVFFLILFQSFLYRYCCLV